MAEATRTLSLGDNATHEAGDQLWMGHAIIPRDLACCEVTVDLPSFPVTSAAKADCLQSAFIVDDLTKHPELKERPYVTDYPHGRYYAGVPITTPAGTNIGTYCILDDKAREGISHQDLVFLRDMSQTVMAHLETVRALSECQQSNQMIIGLGNFVKGASDSKRQPPHETDSPLNEGVMDTVVQYCIPDALVNAAQTLEAQVTSSSARRENLCDATMKSENQQSDQPESSAISANECPPQQAATQLVYERNMFSADPLDTALVDCREQTGFWKASRATRTTGNRVSRPPPTEPESVDKFRSVYQQAAETLCKSLNIDGVAFLDASVGTFGGLSEAMNSTEGGTWDSSDDSAPFLNQSEYKTGDYFPKDQKLCPILGCAQSVHIGIDRATSQPLVRKLTESMLLDLMRRYPDGNIWLYDEDGVIYSEDGESANECVDSKTLSRPTSPVARMKDSAQRHRRVDAEIMQLAFPGARCIAVHGIWDYTRRRWSVGSLYWTYDPFRVLSLEPDMHFVAAFCDVIVAEIRRLEVLRSDEAKSDFISSVSHELRSPLHGILGSTEILSECQLDNTASTMVEQIGSCGNSLFEIIDHLLEFAKLKNQRPSIDAVKNSGISSKTPPVASSASARNYPPISNVAVPLDELTEEAVASSAYSFYYNQSIRDRTDVPVILDVDHSTDLEWRCQHSPGAWKRVCMNLVTNALKYTSVGYVCVTLKQRSRPGSRGRFDALLCVSDSGRGMSREFQRNHLFLDFAQEDSLSHGLGLGMHMVYRMVHAMGGTIEVTSDQDGSGTQVVVSVPLLYDQKRQDHDRRGSGIRISKATGEGLEIDLITGLCRSPSNPEDRLIATTSEIAITSIENNCKFLGAHLERCTWKACNPCDLKILMEADLGACLQMMRDISGRDERSIFTPLIVVCNTSVRAKILRDLWLGDSLSSCVATEYVALPCAVKQLSRAIESILQLHKELVGATSTETKSSNMPEANERGIANGSSDSAQIGARSLERPSQPEPSLQEGTTTSAPSLQVLLARDVQVSSEELSTSTSTSTFPVTGHSSILQCPGSLRIQPTEHSSTEKAVPTVSPLNKDVVLLLVDDNSINLRLLTTFAKKRNYAHITATNGKLAVEAFQAAHDRSCTLDCSRARASGVSIIATPTVILMDINMPVMDGYKAVQHIRLYERKHCMIPAKIIAVTALQSEAAHTEAFGSGFDMFLSKPIKLEALTKLIEE
ncbi:hypothetical protein MBLNU13_g11304t2 [Cladosporium sp. NU13]